MDIIGALAGVLTVIGFVPQAIKTIRSRKTDDLSLFTYLILTTSGTLWVIYGLMIERPSIWVTNTVVAVLCCIVLVLKLKEKQGKRYLGVTHASYLDTSCSNSY